MSKGDKRRGSKEPKKPKQEKPAAAPATAGAMAGKVPPTLGARKGK